MKPASGVTRDHAIVIGGGIAGLLAARVLADHFRQVTLIERDRLPAPESRKGVPQGDHVHCMLAKGQEILAQLFPDLLPSLIAGGAIPADMGLHFHWHHHGVWKTRFDSGIAITFFTRPFLESQIAERVRALPNVRVFDASAEQLLIDRDVGRALGVAIRSSSDAPTSIHADLVVDAGGRGSQTPQWLEPAGYVRPAESAVQVNISYASRLYRAPRAKREWHALHVTSLPPSKRQGVIFAVEGDRLLTTLVGLHGERPPGGDAGYLDFARSLAIPDNHQVIANADPLTPIATLRFPANLRRHYERLAAFPDRLLVMGDAVCTFNPIYGQGMTVSALEAMALGRLLQVDNDLTGVCRKFRKQVADIIDTPWQLATGEDFRHAEAAGARPAGIPFLHWYTGRLHVNCASDAALALAFYRVMHMLDAPSALFRPSVVWRTLRG
ncbi:MAG: FAD-dependent oxidoreductase [Xanthobacteraceae bacterium]|nr:FAD-dependent oxidoreductase [Xanthobacteraceae bacterium]